MKYLRCLITSLVVACPSIVAAQDRAADAIPLEIAYSALHIMDWQQTRRIARDPFMLEEKNLVLGAHPSTLRVNRYFAATLVAHWAIAMNLPDGYRRAFQGVTIGIEANTVRKNYQVGISAKF